MPLARTSRGASVRVSTTDRPVFLDPNGTRWRVLRAVLLAGLVAVVAVLAVLVPRVMAPPALHGAPVQAGPAPDELGDLPIVGTGPLMRIVALGPDAAGRSVRDPFDGRALGRLTGADAQEAAQAPYAIQRYGYSATAHRTISLTFDDGPNPEWTPKLIDLLSRYHVPATFFVTGSQMAKHPDITRRLVREGFAVANHSLSHVDINAARPFRQQLELAVTDRVLRAQTGTYASYFRLPYEGDDEESARGDAPGILRAQQLGYIVASHDFDTLDWAYTSGELTGEIPLPPLDGSQDNITVLLHDGGGADRTLTLQYVERLVLAARDAGYTFQTMPQVQPDIAAVVGPATVGLPDRAALLLAEAIFVLPAGLLHWLLVLALVTMLGLGVLNTVLALVRARRVRRRAAGAGPREEVAVLIAAYNEQLVIGRTLEHVLASVHPVTEVVVVDDGSTDGTAAVVRAVAARDPRVRLLQQGNAGKWAALNRGFEAIAAPVVVTLDADTLITPETVGHLVAGFTAPEVGAVAGVIKVGNHSRNLITRWQALEYLTQIGIERSAAALLNAVMVVPGACAAWRREAVLEAGGYSDATLAEDCDLTLTLHRHGWRVEQAEAAVAWTEAPETVDALLKQRVRWMFGTLQAVWRHRSMLLRPRFGWLGMLVMPMAVVTVVVPLLFTPFIAVVVLQMVLVQGVLHVLLYFGLFSLVYGAFAAVATRLMQESPRHLLMVPLYRLIYEPLRAYLLYASLGTALRGVRLGWNKLARTAHMDDAVTGAPALVAASVVPTPAPAGDAAPAVGPVPVRAVVPVLVARQVEVSA
jgi:cellulose synthase/poly-beta-1,6-N-acetylglucosamine synthase-like glycosyltransferase/peptidoglycan/xylan/chitin deacetylase (PgdA/CDA1 family)